MKPYKLLYGYYTFSSCYVDEESLYIDLDIISSQLITKQNVKIVIKELYIGNNFDGIYFYINN